jgi:hypothetical protein
MFVVLGLLFMMLLPAMTSVVDGSQIRAQPTVEATSTPTEDVPPQEDDELDLTIESTAVPTLPPPPPPIDPEEEVSLHTIRVSNLVCDDDFDKGSDWFTFATECTTALPGVEFTLDIEGAGDTRISDGSGDIEWSEIELGASGEIGLDEAIPTGFGEPVAWCVSFPEAAGDPEDFEMIQMSPVDGSVIATPEQHEPFIFSCTFFNFDEELDLAIPDTNALTVTKYGCPLGAPYEDFGVDIFEFCTEEQAGIDFVFENEGGASPQSTDGAGQIVWDNLSAGEFSVWEDFPDGYGDQIVYCRWLEAPDELLLSSEYFQVPAANGQFDLEFVAVSMDLDCGVFNLPRNPSRIVINKQICPEGVILGDPEADDFQIDDYITTCDTVGDGFEFTLDNAHGSTTKETVDGALMWDFVPHGEFTVTEDVPAGYGEPLWLCRSNIYDEAGDLEVGQNWEVAAAAGDSISDAIDEQHGEIFHCWVFNFADDSTPENDILIYKGECPEGTLYEETEDWYFDNCNVPLDGISFMVTTDAGVQVDETTDGVVAFAGVPNGVAGIQESVPSEYGEPVVFCNDAGGTVRHNAPTGYFSHEFEGGELKFLTCWVFNIPGEPGDVTIYKWTCPAGYDLYAEDADPAADCTEATNGIQFQFGLSGIENLAELQATGDLVDGGVFFDGLDPDTYKAVELVPDGIESVFVLECTGHIMGQLQPYPLQSGNVLEIEVGAGEHLVCQWFNVPELEGGELTIVKYACTTETFVSDVDCEIYEDGQEFDLYAWDGSEFVHVDSGTTDGVGVLAWSEVDPGQYQIDEPDAEWCHIESNVEFDVDGEGFAVSEGEETVIEVYNCGFTWTWDPPTDYPNTGAGPTVRNDDLVTPW